MMELVAYPDLGDWTAHPDGAPLVGGHRPDPSRFWLQVGEDACSEMWVIWQEDATAYTDASIEYRKVGEDAWVTATGTTADHPFTGDGFDAALRKITKVKLTGLSAGTTYEFRFSASGTTFNFRTFPDSLSGGRSVVLANGGDSEIGQATADIAALMAADDVDAVVHGGDWAYADGLAINLSKWDAFWDIICPAFVRGDKRVIPLIPVIGNHEVIGSWSSDRADAPYFYAFFAIPDAHAGAYYEVRAGNEISLVVIDSEHTSGQFSPSSPQIQWLENVLIENAEVRHRVPFMHVPYFPYRRDPASTIETRHRVQLAPRLEQAGIRHVFVHHDHCYARTQRILTNQSDPSDWVNGTVDEGGIVYLGNGAWEKSGLPSARWFDDVSSNAQHYYRITLTETEITATAIRATGAALDTYTDPAGGGGGEVSGAITNAGQQISGSAAVDVAASASIENAGQVIASAASVAVSLTGSLTNAGQTITGRMVNGAVLVPSRITLSLESTHAISLSLESSHVLELSVE